MRLFAVLDFDMRLVLLWLFLICFPGMSIPVYAIPNESMQILVLHSQGSNRSFQLQFNAHLQKELQQQGLKNFSLYIENLDLFQFNHDQKYKENLKILISQKYAEISFDLIITVLPDAAHFVSSFNLFPHVPKLALNPVSSEKELDSLGLDTHAIVFSHDLRGNIEHCLQLFPDTKKIVVISGNSLIDQSFEKIFRSDTKSLQGKVSFEYLSGVELDQLLDRISDLSEHTLIYLLPYNLERGKIFIMEDASEKIGQVANRPVFVYRELYVSKPGILGGRVVSTKFISGWIVKRALQIFKGEKVEPFEIVNSGYKYVYQWKELKRWGINPANLPEDSIILNKEVGFLEAYSTYIITGFVVLIGQAILIMILMFNIRKRKAAETKLLAEQNFTHAIIDASPAFLVVVDRKGIIRMINQSMLDKTGYTREEAINKRYLSIFSPEGEHQLLMDHFYRFLETDTIINVENRVLTKSGNERLIKWFGHSLFNQLGEEKLLLALGLDITEQKQVEEALLSSEQKFKHLFENSPDIIFLMDNDRFIDCNEKACLQFGLSRNEIIGKTPWELSPEYQPDGQKSIDSSQKKINAILSGDQQYFVWHHQKKKGEIFEVEVSLKSIILNERPLIQATLRDTTERRRAESALIESEKRYRTLFEAAVDAIWIIEVDENLALKIIDCNENALHMFRGCREDIIGLSPLDMSTLVQEDQRATEEKAREIIQNVLDGKPQFFEWAHRRLDGSTFPAEVSINSVSIGDKTYVQAITRDISERKKIEEELTEYREHLETLVKERTRELQSEIKEHQKTEKQLQKAKEIADIANRSKSEFLANMSHEVRTPMNVILGYCQLMERDGSLSSVQRENLQTIRRSGDHLLTLINDILDMSKIEAGHINLNLEEFNLHNTILNIEEMIRVRAKSKNLQFISTVDDSVPKYVISDEHKIRQILLNLIGNAIKFTDQGKVGLVVKCKGLQLHFEVSDTGPGIDKSYLEKLFDPFTQSDAGVRSSEGSGLGLAISQKYVHLMGGNISVSSVLGEGSLFSFSINITLLEKKPLDKQVENRRVIHLAPGQDEIRILIVEDNRDSRLLMGQLLDQTGFETREATNGKQAIEIVENWQPQLIFMDMRMPVMDGYEATRLIKSDDQKKEIYIIALTASAFEEDRQKILSIGCDDFIRKPFEEIDIFEVIEKVLKVKFIYDDNKDEDITDFQKMNATQLIQALASIPDDLIPQLNQAIEMLDTGVINTIIEQLKAKNEKEAAEALSLLAKDYRFDLLSEWMTHQN